MAKTDLVPTYIDGQPQDGKPYCEYRRLECREMKKRGEGLFQRHGKIFVIYKPLAKPPADQSSAFSLVRITANSRSHGLVAPQRHHYQVPAAGDHRIAWLNRFMKPVKEDLGSDLDGASARA